MKKFIYYVLGLAVANVAACSLLHGDATPATNAPLKVAYVNFKECVEGSKLGKQEQSTFENLKKQMEKALEEQEKTLTDLASKLNDTDYLDSLTPEAETELKRKFRSLNQEMNQVQGQYYQTLNQANMQIVQKLQEAVSAAATKIAKDENYDVVLNGEAGFFINPAMNISKKVIKVMDDSFEVSTKETSPK